MGAGLVQLAGVGRTSDIYKESAEEMEPGSLLHMVRGQKSRGTS